MIKKAEKIRLLHVITDLSTGGAQMMLYKLLSEIDKTQFDCRVVCLMGQDVMAQKISALDIPVTTLGMRRSLPDPIAFVRLCKMIRAYSPDIVQTWLYHADLLGGLAARFVGVRTVIWNIRHNNLHAKINKWHTRMTAKVCALLSTWVPRAIICNSQNSTAVHQAIGYKKALFRLIGNGFDLQKFTAEDQAKAHLCRQLNIPQDSILVGLVARFDAQKDQHNFVNAIAGIVGESANVQAIMIGTNIDSQNVELKQWISASGVQEHFHLLGERADIAELTAALDIACSSSLGESFPNAIGEAMACAVPCVVTNVGDSAELVGDTGVVVPAADHTALADAILNLVNTPQARRKKMGINARKRIEQYYCLAAIVKKYQNLYLEFAAISTVKGQQ